jgi:hypothetical protein
MWKRKQHLLNRLNPSLPEGFTSQDGKLTFKHPETYVVIDKHGMPQLPTKKAEPVPVAAADEDPMTCVLREGDEVEVVYPCPIIGLLGKRGTVHIHGQGTRWKVTGPNGEDHGAGWGSRSSLKLIRRAHNR